MHGISRKENQSKQKRKAQVSPVAATESGYEANLHPNLARRVWPELPNHQLSTLEAHIGLEFNHHHAQADAEAAGRVLVAMMKQVNATTVAELMEKMGMVPEQFCR
jgi:hypothetical protein